MEIGHWVYIVVTAMVLFIVISALFGPVNTALGNYAANETTFGPIIQSLFPILLGVGILIGIVTTMLPGGRLSRPR